MKPLHRTLSFSKHGFTLIELTVISSLALVVLMGLYSTFFASYRLVKETLACAEMSLRARTLKEKMLFRINATGGLLNTQSMTIAANGSRLVCQQGSYPIALEIKDHYFAMDNTMQLRKNWLNQSLSTFKLDSCKSSYPFFNLLQMKEFAHSSAATPSYTALWVTYQIVSDAPNMETAYAFRIPNLKSE